MINLTFFIGLFFLVFFTYQDYLCSKIENKPILTFIFLALVFSWINKNLLLEIPLMLFTFILGLYLWKKDIIGGADIKIMPGIIPFLALNGIGQTIAGYLFFLLVFAICGALYGLTARLFLRKHKLIPFLPVFLLSFLVFWFYRRTWI